MDRANVSVTGFSLAKPLLAELRHRYPPQERSRVVNALLEAYFAGRVLDRQGRRLVIPTRKPKTLRVAVTT